MRKTLSILMVVMLLTTSLVLIQASDEKEYEVNSLASSPWPLFRGNANRTGLSEYSTSRNFGDLLWKFKTGDAIDSSPAIGPDETIYVGSNDGYLYAINPNGTLKWKYDVGGPVKSSPAIGTAGIYFGYGKYLYSVDFNGVLRWKYNIGSIESSSPAIRNDIIYVLSEDSTLYAIRDNGNLYWKHVFFDNNPNPSTSSPAVGEDGTIYVGLPDPYDNQGEDYEGHVFALSPSGSELWDYFAGYGEVQTTPALGSDGLVYFQTFGGIMGDYNYLVAVYASNGTEKWRYSLECNDMVSGYEGSSPAIDSNGGIYVNSGDGLFLGGVEIYNFGGNSVYSSPSISSGGTIWLGCDDGNIYAMKYTEGDEDASVKAECKTGGAVRSSPAIGSDGTVYVGSGDGYLYALGDTTITIYNNTDFQEKAAKYGWKGDGTEENPYIIENKNIYAHHSNVETIDAIHIEDTDVHFIIRNCTISGDDSQTLIYMDNVKNGTFENNSISEGEYGMYILESSDLTIRDNTIRSATEDGISLYQSPSNIIENNNISINKIGVYLMYNSNNNIIDNNTFYKNSDYGVYISNNIRKSMDSSGNKIFNNYFRYNHGSGNRYNSSCKQANDTSGGNYWDVNGKGNYWLDWAENNRTNDANRDGIVDWPYIIDGDEGAKDHYPLKPLIVLYFQTENSEIGGYENLTDLSVDPLGGNGTVMTEKISSAGIYRIGNISWMSEEFERYFSTNDTWTFRVYGRTSAVNIHGHLLVKVYRYSENSSELLFESQSPDDIYGYTSPHLFIWNETGPDNIIWAGERIAMELYLNVSSVSIGRNDIYDYSDGLGKAYYCDVDNYPPEGNYLNSKDELDKEGYASISSQDGIEYESANPGTGDKSFMWFETKISNEAEKIKEMDFFFRGHPASDSTMYIYLYNWTSGEWEPDELICKDFSTSDAGMEGVLEKGFTNYVNESGVVRWGVYSEASNTSVYVDYVDVTVMSDEYADFTALYDWEKWDSGVITGLYGIHKMDINVQSGWNMISLPWQRNKVSIEKALSGISWTKAMVYINNKWYVYNKERDAKYNLGFPEIDNTMGIWVECTENGVIDGPDWNRSTTIELHKGWNLVGYPSTHAKKVSDVFYRIPWRYLETMDESGNMQHLSISDYMQTGKAYWIYVTSDCTWTVQW